MKKQIKDLALATTKGVVGAIPFAGPLFAEYIALAKETVGNKRQQKWCNLIEERLGKLDCKIDDLASNEMFFSAIQIATAGAMKSYQKEKREYFANALLNTIQISDITEEKKLIFFSLLDNYTLLSIKLLKYYSENHYREEDFIQRQGMMTTRHWGGTEYPIKYMTEMFPELGNEYSLVFVITSQIIADGLVEPFDLKYPASPEQARRKRTTGLGDEFLRFILTDEHI